MSRNQEKAISVEKPKGASRNEQHLPFPEKIVGYLYKQNRGVSRSPQSPEPRAPEAEPRRCRKARESKDKPLGACGWGAGPLALVAFSSWLVQVKLRARDASFAGLLLRSAKPNCPKAGQACMHVSARLFIRQNNYTSRLFSTATVCNHGLDTYAGLALFFLVSPEMCISPNGKLPNTCRGRVELAFACSDGTKSWRCASVL